jgi:hypothetical protein
VQKGRSAAGADSKESQGETERDPKGQSGRSPEGVGSGGLRKRPGGAEGGRRTAMGPQGDRLARDG